jgi:hypothetical protein
MRALLALVALALGAFRAPAQTRPAEAPKASQAPATKTDSAGQIANEIAERRAQGDTHLPDAEQFTVGDRSIAARTRVDGPIAVAKGNLDVYGTVDGDVVVLGGNVRVHNGGRVTGDAWSAGGSVIIDGGVVEGQKRSIAISAPSLPPSRPHQPLSTWESAKLVIGWFALLMIIGLGVMVFADANLDGVVVALERGFARSFWVGIAGQVALLPGLVTLVVALAVTVLGALLIPFAIVAYTIAAAGVITLGFLAVARLAGGAITSQHGATSPRGVNLRALVSGLAIFLGIWMVAALFAWNPIAGAILRAIAIALTWVAATLGLGAALISRAGTKRSLSAAQKASTDEFAWQTPTPVSGVAASRRAVSSSR